MENNNNGRGVFYGVIGVATLVVAIIGATFAYFSASVTGVNNVQAGATTIDLNFADKTTTGIKNDLIPIELDGKGKATYDGLTAATYGTIDSTSFPSYYSTYAKGGFSSIVGVNESTSCKDQNNNSICSVYTFTISNPSATTAQTVYGSMTVTHNDFTNLHYAVFVGDDTEINTRVDSSSVKVGYNVLGTETGNDSNSISLAATDAMDFYSTDRKSLKSGGLVQAGKIVPQVGGTDVWDNAIFLLYADNDTSTATPKETRRDHIEFTVVVWLEETGETQEAEEGKTMTANITFDTGTGTGVTGTLGVTG